jgi:hypothetical protein
MSGNRRAEKEATERNLHGLLSEKKGADVREVQICVRKLAANAGDCAILKCACFKLLSETGVRRLASR